MTSVLARHVFRYCQMKLQFWGVPCKSVLFLLRCPSLIFILKIWTTASPSQGALLFYFISFKSAAIFLVSMWFYDIFTFRYVNQPIFHVFFKRCYALLLALLRLFVKWHLVFLYMRKAQWDWSHAILGCILIKAMFLCLSFAHASFTGWSRVQFPEWNISS